MTNEVFLTARQAWGEWAGLRARRDRFKRFVYGDQWSDSVTLPDGRTVSEYEAMASSGAHPLTNNLLRQIVKTVVGRYRADIATEERSHVLADIASMNSLDELDARALEEFLISGGVAELSFSLNFRPECGPVCRTEKNQQKPQLSQAEAFLCP